MSEVGYRRVRLRSDSAVYHLQPLKRWSTLCGKRKGSMDAARDGDRPCPVCQRAQKGEAQS